MADYYEILDVDPQASTEQIMAQYRFLVKAWHPDKFPSPENKARAEEKLQRINEAKTVLLDPIKRQEYDNLRGASGPAASQPSNYQPGQAAQAQRASANNADQATRPRPASPAGPKQAPGDALWDMQILELAPGVPMEFVRVPAGEFLMGSLGDDLSYPNELPQHSVYLNEYLIGKYPVTNRQYRLFMEATGHSHWEYGTIQKNKENHPVVAVSWQDASAFCEWASFVTRMNVRLPSEAEWEKAARGTDGRTYPWGSRAPEHSLLNFAKKIGDTSQVGATPGGASPYGALDMAGNAWEWVNDRYDEHYYEKSPARNPPGPESGEYRILRGGAWSSSLRNVRSMMRLANLPNDAGTGSGFRCARDLPGG
jgi:formylglycine-generating enzyme required for sulfatase activity